MYDKEERKKKKKKEKKKLTIQLKFTEDSIIVILHANLVRFIAVVTFCLIFRLIINHTQFMNVH